MATPKQPMISRHLAPTMTMKPCFEIERKRAIALLDRFFVRDAQTFSNEKIAMTLAKVAGEQAEDDWGIQDENLESVFVTVKKALARRTSLHVTGGNKKPGRYQIGSPIILLAIPDFPARGMRRVHCWRLTRMVDAETGWVFESNRFHAYHGEIWATNDGRLLVRFKSPAIPRRRCYEICGLPASDLLARKFARGSAEAAALRGNVIKIRDNGTDIEISGGNVGSLNYFGDGESFGAGYRIESTEKVFWLSWVPDCVRKAWNDWVDELEFG